MQRDSVLEQRDAYLAVRAMAGADLVGCCICLVREDVSTVQVRFGAFDAGSRHHRLTRAMYLRVCQIAREGGYRNVSLGTDPTLYGHIAKPGLFRFKSHLGFTPVPDQPNGPEDEADLVLRLDALSDPSLVLAYQAPEPPATLRLDVLTRDPHLDMRPYQAPFLAAIEVRTVAP